MLFTEGTSGGTSSAEMEYAFYFKEGGEEKMLQSMNDLNVGNFDRCFKVEPRLKSGKGILALIITHKLYLSVENARCIQ